MLSISLAQADFRASRSSCLTAASWGWDSSWRPSAPGTWPELVVGSAVLTAYRPSSTSIVHRLSGGALARRPIELAAAQDVEMQMVDALAGVGAYVGDDA